METSGKKVWAGLNIWPQSARAGTWKRRDRHQLLLTLLPWNNDRHSRSGSSLVEVCELVKLAHSSVTPLPAKTVKKTDTESDSFPTKIKGDLTHVGWHTWTNTNTHTPRVELTVVTLPPVVSHHRHPILNQCTTFRCFGVDKTGVLMPEWCTSKSCYWGRMRCVVPYAILLVMANAWDKAQCCWSHRGENIML